MKKIHTLLLAGLTAALALVSCEKIEEVSSIIPQDIVVNIAVGNLDGSPDTKAVKTSWESGDKINIWFGENGSKILPELVLTRNAANTAWEASTMSAETISALQASGGTFKAVYESSNSLFTSASSSGYIDPSSQVFASFLGQTDFKLYHMPLVCYAQNESYTFENGTLTADIGSWRFKTGLQVVVSGLDKDHPENYAMRICDEAGTAAIFDVAQRLFVGKDKADGGQSGKLWTGGISNADGVAFYFEASERSETTFRFELYDFSTNTAYSYTKAGTISLDINHLKAIKISAGKFGILPDGALSGVFSVSETRKVHFSKGNLWCNWSANPKTWELESHQYDVPPSQLDKYNNDIPVLSHVGYFTWNSFPRTNEVLDWGAPYCIAKGLPVGTWRGLSIAEWEYLLNTRGTSVAHLRNAVTVCGLTNCLVIAPDGNDTVIKDSYDDDEWAAAEAAGFVCLPSAGGSGEPESSNMGSIGVYGRYWSSTNRDDTYAFRAFFRSTYISYESYGFHYEGCSVRLVTDAN